MGISVQTENLPLSAENKHDSLFVFFHETIICDYVLFLFSIWKHEPTIMQTCCFICHQICMGSTETESFFGCASALAKRTSKHLRRRLFHALFVQLLETTCVYFPNGTWIVSSCLFHTKMVNILRVN